VLPDRPTGHAEINVFRGARFVLPVLQSGSGPILRRMRRSYTPEAYCDVVDRVRDLLDDPALTTDVLVGFPGESEEAFQATRQAVELLPFTYFHVFAYSERPATAAASFRDAIPKAEKKRRSQELREIGARKRAAAARQLVGTRARVLVERYDATGHYLQGYTDNYQRVTVPGAGGETSGETNRFVELILRPEHLDTLRQAPAPVSIG